MSKRLLHIVFSICLFGAGALFASSLQELDEVLEVNGGVTEVLGNKSKWQFYEKHLVQYLGKENLNCQKFEDAKKTLADLSSKLPHYTERLSRGNKAEVFHYKDASGNQYSLRKISHAFHTLWMFPQRNECKFSVCNERDELLVERWTAGLIGAQNYVLERNGKYQGVTITIVPVQKKRVRSLFVIPLESKPALGAKLDGKGSLLKDGILKDLMKALSAQKVYIVQGKSSSPKGFSAWELSSLGNVVGSVENLEEFKLEDPAASVIRSAIVKNCQAESVAAVNAPGTPSDVVPAAGGTPAAAASGVKITTSFGTPESAKGGNEKSGMPGKVAAKSAKAGADNPGAAENAQGKPANPSDAGKTIGGSSAKLVDPGSFSKDGEDDGKIDGEFGARTVGQKKKAATGGDSGGSVTVSGHKHDFGLNGAGNGVGSATNSGGGNYGSNYPTGGYPLGYGGSPTNPGTGADRADRKVASAEKPADSSLDTKSKPDINSQGTLNAKDKAMVDALKEIQDRLKVGAPIGDRDFEKFKEGTRKDANPIVKEVAKDDVSETYFKKGADPHVMASMFKVVGDPSNPLFKWLAQPKNMCQFCNSEFCRRTREASNLKAGWIFEAKLSGAGDVGLNDHIEVSPSKKRAQNIGTATPNGVYPRDKFKMCAEISEQPADPTLFYAWVNVTTARKEKIGGKTVDVPVSFEPMTASNKAHAECRILQTDESGKNVVKMLDTAITIEGKNTEWTVVDGERLGKGYTKGVKYCIWEASKFPIWLQCPCDLQTSDNSFVGVPALYYTGRPAALKSEELTEKVEPGNEKDSSFLGSFL